MFSSVQAHPVPRNSYDRTIQVQLTREAVIVAYRLEVDEYTAYYDLVTAGSDAAGTDLSKLRRPAEFYSAYTKYLAPILADNLIARFNGRALTFTCMKQGHEVLDHLRCDFVFRAEWMPESGRRSDMTFQDGTFYLEAGMVRLALSVETPLAVLAKKEPDAALQERAAIDLKPGDEAKLRQAAATFVLQAATGRKTPAPAPRTDETPRSEAPTGPAAVVVVVLAGLWVLRGRVRRLRGP